MTKSVVSSLNTCSGSPRIDGTRLTCANVVLSLTLNQMSLARFLTVYRDLSRADIQACAQYCASRQCVPDKVANFCQRCSLDRRPEVACEMPVLIESLDEADGDRNTRNHGLDVWEYAQMLLDAHSSDEWSLAAE